MKVIQHDIVTKSRSEEFRLWALGDVHIGALNCAEKELKGVIANIKSDPNAFWIGGGDMCDAVILGDSKRFDVNSVPDWMLAGAASSVRGRMGDILGAQIARFKRIFSPIKDKCLGMIEGNHEYSIYKYHNRDHMADLCAAVNAENLTDCAFVRLRFLRENRSKKSGGKSDRTGYRTRSVDAYICHGHGGGRTPGAEPNQLHKLAVDKEADIVMRGHSHTYHIMPPMASMHIGAPGPNVVDAPLIREKHIANWGSYVYTYAKGPSTYASRATYPVRAMYTVCTHIVPHKSGRGTREQPQIRMEEYQL